MLDNYRDFKKYIASFPNKPSLLLHSCCGPCSTHTLKILVPFFQVTVFFDNSNIDTEEEFTKRLMEQKKVIAAFNEKIVLVVGDYLPQTFYKAVKGYEKMGEFSLRCANCMELRMENSALYAKEHHFDFFTTTLSISPYKDSRVINEIGYRLAEKYQISFLYSNFKKENGYQDSIKISSELALYRQDYCGCVFSKREHEEKLYASKIKN